ncbi:MAG TPA: cytochrome c oxidase assembly protein [Gemmatimonadales bacterium]|nr:cytochrome c oxidase assembly protein [Gemmatimonadales bacterium]
MTFAPLLALALHGDGALVPHDLWRAWTWEPGQVTLLGLSGVLYARGALAMRRRRGVPPAELTLFALGWISLALALVSPIHELGESLFSAHMVQHELLMAVAAPLLVLGRPLAPMLRGLPRSWRLALGALARRPSVRRAWRWLSRPAVATAIQMLVLWIWHLPAVFSTVLVSDLAHAAQHASFLGSALLFWWAMLGPRARRVHAGENVGWLFVTMLLTGALGALLTLATVPWYPAYAARTAAWGVTPLEDQQLAGLIMWVPAGTAYIAAALWLFVCWLHEAERQAVRHERERDARERDARERDARDRNAGERRAPRAMHQSALS